MPKTTTVFAVIICLLGALIHEPALAQTCSPSPSAAIGWWPADGTSQDIVGGKDGFLQAGAGIVPGLVRKAFRFDGVDDYVNLPTSRRVTGQSAVSVEGWIRRASAASPGVIYFEGVGGNGLVSFVVGGDDRLAIGFRSDATNGGPEENSPTVVRSVDTIPAGVWTHVGATVDLVAKAYSLYINGVEVAATGTDRTTRTSFLNAPNNVHIGIASFFPNSGFESPFHGEIDELTFIHRVLSAAEIQAIFNGGAGIAAEVCDGLDNDCDASTDEDYPSIVTSCGVGACAGTGLTSCVGGSVIDSCTPGTPAADDSACNALDDDCDAATDEGYASVPTSCGVGACTASGSTSCAGGSVVDSCTPGTPAADDSACNALDDDCDAATDEDYTSVATSCGIGACTAGGSTSCSGGSVHDSCTPGTPAADDSTCNALDDDCDASTDEDYASVPTVCGSGTCSSTGATDCMAGAEIDTCEAGVPGSEDVCDGGDDDCDAVTDEGFITVTATRHTTGPGSNPPANTAPISDLPVGVYDRSLNGCSGSCGPSDYACWVSTLGCAQVAQGTTNALGQISFEVEPGLYLVISDGGTTHKMGKHVDLACGETKTPDLREIVTPNGKAHAGKSSVRTGSYLLVIEPEAVVWSGEAEYYPFIFESLGDWGVTTSVAPPEGFVADHESLSAEVTTETEALQFVITDVGSDWVPTEVQHRLTHGARREVMRSKVAVKLHPELARTKGLDPEGYRLDGRGRRIPEARPDPRVEKPAEIVGWVEPTAADPEWLIKVSVRVAGPVVVRLESGDGRHIRTLPEGRLEPGEHVLAWDGNDAAGKAPRAGGLQVRLLAGGIEDRVWIVPSEGESAGDPDRTGRINAEAEPINPIEVLEPQR